MVSGAFVLLVHFAFHTPFSSSNSYKLRKILNTPKAAALAFLCDPYPILETLDIGI